MNTRGSLEEAVAATLETIRTFTRPDGVLE
jgi:hypothetical protein